MSWLDELTADLQGQTFQPGQNFQPSGTAGGRPFYLNPTYSQSPMQQQGLMGLADEFTPQNMLAGGGTRTGYTASLTGQSNRGEYITNPETGETGYVQARFGPNGEYIGAEFIPAQSPSGFSDVRRVGPAVVGAAIGAGMYAGAGGAGAGVPGGGAGALDMGYSAAGAGGGGGGTFSGIGAGGAAAGGEGTFFGLQPPPTLPPITPPPPGSSNFLNYALPVASIINAGVGAYAARRAGQEQLEGINASNQLAREIYEADVERQKPFYDFSLEAVNRLRNPGDEFMKSPGYTFGLEQGLKARDRVASRGGYATGGGRREKELIRFGSGYTQQGYGDWVGQQMQQAGYGPQSANAMQNASQNYGQTVGSGERTAGNVRGSQYGGYAASIQQPLNNALQFYMLNNLLNRGS
jgi:hypothetical protein